LEGSVAILCEVLPNSNNDLKHITPVLKTEQPFDFPGVSAAIVSLDYLTG